jgi:hypothetical protein
MEQRIRWRFFATLGILFSLQTTTVEAQSSCFTTLGEINMAMQTELDRIREGGTPEDSYTFRLCANQFFDASLVFLEPVLNNAMFVCGETGSRSDSCVILGGSQQVLIRDSTVPGYPLLSVSFMGITFAGFEPSTGMTGTSIAALASVQTVATFIDVAWQVRRTMRDISFPWDANFWVAYKFSLITSAIVPVDRNSPVTLWCGSPQTEAPLVP